jgi:hypothetical protein
MLYLIYKMFYTKDGNIEKVELVEADQNESSAMSFSKLYGLQVPKDLKDRIAYGYVGMRIV